MSKCIRSIRYWRYGSSRFLCFDGSQIKLTLQLNQKSNLPPDSSPLPDPPTNRKLYSYWYYFVSKRAAFFELTLHKYSSSQEEENHLSVCSVLVQSTKVDARLFIIFIIKRLFCFWYKVRKLILFRFPWKFEIAGSTVISWSYQGNITLLILWYHFQYPQEHYQTRKMVTICTGYHLPAALPEASPPSSAGGSSFSFSSSVVTGK